MSAERELLRAPEEDLQKQEKYQVQLQTWTGPYDILLQVIDDQDLDLFDLDISKLLEHYLVYLESLSIIDIDEAGEFLVVAATLAQIKSKLLLPKEETAVEVEEKDPREDLVRYLMEYQKIKAAAELLGERPVLGRDVFVKGNKETFEGIEAEGKGTLFQLVKGFQKAMRDLGAQTPMAFTVEAVSVSERFQDIFNELKSRRELEFADIIGLSPSKTYLIASFLALLELARLKKIKIYGAVDGDGLFIRIVEGAEFGDVHSEFDVNQNAPVVDENAVETA